MFFRKYLFFAFLVLLIVSSTTFYILHYLEEHFPQIARKTHAHQIEPTEHVQTRNNLTKELWKRVGDKELSHSKLFAKKGVFSFRKEEEKEFKAIETMEDIHIVQDLEGEKKSFTAPSGVFDYEAKCFKAEEISINDGQVKATASGAEISLGEQTPSGSIDHVKGFIHTNE